MFILDQTVLSELSFRSCSNSNKMEVQKSRIQSNRIIQITYFQKSYYLKTKKHSKHQMEQKGLIPTQPTPCQQKDIEVSNQALTPLRQVSSQQKITKIKLLSKTWTKDSYGLFDYQAKQDQYDLQSYFIEETTFIVRNNKSCETILVKDLSQLKIRKQHNQETQRHLPCSSYQNKEEYTVLGQVIVDRTRKSPSFKIKLHQSPQDLKKAQNQIQIKHSHNTKRLIPFILADCAPPKSQGYPLQPGNIIKFGRVEYLILESFNGKDTQSYRDSVYLDEGDNVFDVLKQRQLLPPVPQNQDKQNINCKICLCNEETQDDPLISPCRCKGYCGVIHTNCLRTWINNKVKKQSLGRATSYNFTKFQCEICKAPFPKMVRTQVDEVQMMKIDKPSKPYIMLQSLDPLNNHLPSHTSSMMSGQKQKLLHVISAQDKCPIKIGRANQCEIRLMDISVSRKHAQIRLVQGQFFIRDTGAKFGTLVQWSGVGTSNKGDIININRKKPLKIQLGRTAYQLSVEDISEDIDTQ